MITRETVRSRISAYLNHQLSLEELVDWAERALLDEAVEERDAVVLRDVVARLGLADVRQFGLTWEDFSTLLARLGYITEVRVVAAD
ncbi:MAG: hypothetical protein NZM11_10525 [Anaerolineales bacterium]|nr:hypothetical protein [Anaerolineales bacterium]